MRRFTLLLCMALVAGPLFSQSIDWLNTWSGKGDKSIDNVIYTGDDHIFLHGKFRGSLDLDPGSGTDTYGVPSTTREYSYVAKLDTNGNYLWGKAFIEPLFSDQYRRFGMVKSDEQGNLYIVGRFAGTFDFSFNSTSAYYTSAGDTTRNTSGFLLKVSPSGALLWFNEYAPSNLPDPNGHGPSLSSIILRNSRLIVLGGYLDETDFDLGPGTAILAEPTPAISYDQYGFFLELDPNGNFLNVTSLEGVVPSFLREDDSGNFYIAGVFSDSLDVDISSQTHMLYSNGLLDMYVMSIDSQLNFSWGHAYGGPDSDFFRTMEVDGQGNIYLTGHYYGTVDFDPGPGQALGFGGVRCILGYNSDGSLKWAGELELTVSPINILMTPPGKVMISGAFQGDPDFDPGSSTYQPVGACAGNFCSGSFAIELDPANGNLAESSFWTYGENPLTNSSSYGSIGHVFHVNPSGSKYIAGSWAGRKDFDSSSDTLYLNSFNLPDSGITYFDAYAMKVNPSNLVEITEESFEEQLNIFPNPASDHFTIAWEGNAVADGLLYSSQGKLIDQFKIPHSHTQIDVGHLPAGIYFVEVRSRNGLVRKAIAVQ